MKYLHKCNWILKLFENIRIFQHEESVSEMDDTELSKVTLTLFSLLVKLNTSFQHWMLSL